MKQAGTALLVTLASTLALTAGAGAATPGVTLTSPTAGTPLLETATLTAHAPGAYAVAFRGRWADADGIRRWHHLGTDRDASDGFSLQWSPAAARTRAHVFVGARALARGGRVLAAARSVQLTTTPERPASTAGGVGAQSPGPRTVFRVVDTCGSGSCRLTRRATPEAAGRALGTLAEGAALTIDCQASGGLVSARAGTSRVWNRLPDGSWVSDLYVDTPGTSGFTDGLPRCATR